MDIDTHESRMSYVSNIVVIGDKHTHKGYCLRFFNVNRICNGTLLVYFAGSRIDAQLYIQMKI